MNIETKGCLMCGKCCGLVPAFPSELATIDLYILANNIKPVLHRGTTCPFLSSHPGDPFHYCLIHPVRPRICRAFPHSHLMTCPNGAGPKLPEPLIKAMVFPDKERAATTLNEYYGAL